MTPQPVPHMTPDEFRRLGHQMVDWIAAYWERAENYPVLSRSKPGEIFDAIPEHAPEQGMDAHGWQSLFEDVEQTIMPGITHWQSPNFFAYFPANVSGPAVLGELLSAGLGVQGMLWQTSPACTELEMRVLDWLGEAIGLPEAFLWRSRSVGGGVIQGTASEAALVAMIAARNRARAATGGDAQDRTLVAYASEQAHSSILKAALICGLCKDASDKRSLRLVATGPDHAMNPAELERLMNLDILSGDRPFFVCASVGTTSSTAVDRVDAIAAVINKVRIPAIVGKPWLHVDAAHAGAACICPEHRWMLAGIEHADSVCFNPHKWLLTNFDCDCFWTRDHRAIVDAMSVTPEYLRNAATESGRVVDFRDWQVPLGRRFRSLKLWMVIRHYGLEGLRAYIREHVGFAQLFESLVNGDGRFETCAPRTLNLVC
ncbi:MAG TPA: pyridoxal-dependent decarboxylase, partial [Phycisphaerales bacterium]|nr:pyridoxal-dependent decarboxylase [Phycisphaerales bacterium]